MSKRILKVTPRKKPVLEVYKKTKPVLRVTPRKKIKGGKGRYA